MPGTSPGSFTRYTASRLRVPASVRSNPVPSVNRSRNASGPLPGLVGVSGMSSRHRSQPPLARCVIRCSGAGASLLLTVRSRNLPCRPTAVMPVPRKRGERRIVGLQNREFGYIGTIYHAADSAIAQVRGK